MEYHSMKIQKNLISTVLSIFTLIIFSVSIAEAESGIKNRQVFVGTSARALGMGGAFTAGPASSDSPFWNPSSLGLLESTELSLIGLPFPASADDREGAFSLGLNPQQLGIASTDVGNFSVSSWFDGWGNDLEKNRMVLVGYGTSLGNGIAAGTNLRHYRHIGSINQRYGWSFDLGIRFVRELERPGEKVTIGLALEDLAGHIWQNGEPIARIPTVTRLGAAHSLDQYTTLSGDFVLHNDTRIIFSERLRTHLGVERWLFKKGLGLRLGYTAIPNRLTDGEWSTGLSIQSPSGQLDYAYVRGSELDGVMHWISATLRWGEGNVRISVLQPPITQAPPPAPTRLAPIVMPEPISYVLHISEKAISPNGDDVKDQTVFDFEVAEGQAWELEIQKHTDQGESGKIFQRYSGTGLPSTKVAWEGEDDAGNRVRDGAYIARWFTVDQTGKRQLQSEGIITVDTTPASLEISAEPPIFGSSGTTTSGEETVLQMPKVHLQASDLNPLARWQLQFFDGDQKLVHRIDDEGEPSDTVVWNNWEQSDNSQKATYRCVLTVHDIAGNRSTGEASFSIIRVDRKDLDNRENKVVATSTEDKQVEVEVSPTPPKYTLMVGSFQDRKNAESLVDSLEALELRAKTHLTEVMIRSRLWYRVTIGGFHNREDAAELISQVVELGMEPLVISNAN
jgi:hypothetical protein